MGVKFEAPVVGDVRPGSAAESAVLVSGDAGDASTLDSGMQPGDRVLSIDGRDMPTFADVQVAAAMAVPGGDNAHRCAARGASGAVACDYCH